MPQDLLKVVVVGASSLLGKELSEELTDSALGTAEIVLVDTEAVAGQITTVGDEASFILQVNSTSFERADFAFFAGSPEQTMQHWQSARNAGATVIDLTGALSDQPDVTLWSPWLTSPTGGTKDGTGFVPRKPDLQTTVIVSAHPVAIVLALIMARLMERFGKADTMAATVLQPASEFGSAGLDELHQQTVSLLSFKELPQEVFDAQVAFNVLLGFGEEAERKMSTAEGLIEAHYAGLSKGQLTPLNLQLVQAPVFHGYTGSVFVALPAAATMEAVQRALDGGKIEVAKEGEQPSNLSAAGQAQIFLSARMTGGQGDSASIWINFAVDNLKLAAANAIDSALGMRSLRPRGKVQ